MREQIAGVDQGERRASLSKRDLNESVQPQRNLDGSKGLLASGGICCVPNKSSPAGSEWDCPLRLKIPPVLGFGADGSPCCFPLPSLAMRFKRKSQVHATPVESTPRDFSFSTTRIAISQICKSTGFKSAQLSSLDILTEVAVRYLSSIAKFVGSSANASGRTESNIFDILHGLEDVHLGLGFMGASCIPKDETPLQTSGIIRQLIEFVNDSCEIPFAKPLPRVDGPSGLPLIEHNDDITLSLPSIDVTCHLPGWLPAFPNVSTHPEKDRQIRLHWGEINAVKTVASDQTICEEKKSVYPRLKEADIAARGGKRVENGVKLRLRNMVSYGEKRVYCNTIGDPDDIAQTKRRKSTDNVFS
ncbi:hypothetical protein MLD38_023747 [Melastoma candidum]|uniref:Uncharacterized protein n=1 Tax=Melastoma candidum TaxID=119954 RepID=A0ACB9NQK6_9MYRT|nr:hypothetical protein MLD38_023747 [Melastoma candidum]